MLVLATAFGLWRRRTDGRIRSVAPASAPVPAVAGADDRPVLPQADGAEQVEPARGDVLAAMDIGAELGERATLVQFSTAFCAPCRSTRVTLAEVAGMVDGVTYVDVDAEAHLDLVRRLDVRRTPTVLVLDSQGTVRRRASGAPRRAEVIAALGEVV